MDTAKFRHLDKLRSAIYGFAVADALGVPVEFKQRGSFHVTDMMGYGTHNQPIGTWSDDTSMTLATCDSLRELQSIVPDDIMKRFHEWCYKGNYTAHGDVFDIGGTTYSSISRYNKGCNPIECGFDTIDANGNGSLMRILPLAFIDSSMEDIRNISRLTHVHEISLTGCEIYIHVAKRLLNGEGLEDILATLDYVKPYERLSLLGDLEGCDIRSSGYVVHTLEAALWCILTTNSYKDCVLKAVNLGDDTDTVGAVAGGLAGIIYGYHNIPSTWIDKLQNKNLIETCLFS